MGTRMGLLAVLVAFLCASATAQSRFDIAGEWFGYITQRPAGLAERYFFELKLELDGDRFKGESRISLQDSTAIYGVMDVQGTIMEPQIWIDELQVKEQNMFSFAYWCIKSYKLQANWVRGILVMEGWWESDNCGYSAGFIHLERRLS